MAFNFCLILMLYCVLKLEHQSWTQLGTGNGVMVVLGVLQIGGISGYWWVKNRIIYFMLLIALFVFL